MTSKPTPDKAEQKRKFLETLFHVCRQEACREGKTTADADRMFLEKAMAKGIPESEARKWFD